MNRIRLKSSRRKLEIVNKRILNIICELIGSNVATNMRDLNLIGKKLLGDKFLGVFTKDKSEKLFNNMKEGESLISNTDTTEEAQFTGGTHWLAIVKSSGELLEYDSFGRRFFKDTVITDDDKEQSTTESNCGQRCISFLVIERLYGGEIAKLL